MIIALIRYGAVFLAVALGVALVVQYANSTWDSTLGSAAQIMVPAMIAAGVEGSQFAKAERRKPNSAEIWGLSWLAMFVATGLNIALAFLAGDLAPEFGKLAIAPFPSKQFLILIGLYAGGYLICNRMFLGIGAGNKLSLMRSKGLIE